VEGGGDIVVGALAEDLLAEDRLFMAPLVLGGNAPSWVGGPGAKRLDKAHKFRYFGATDRVGPDLAIVLRRANDDQA